MIFALGFLFQVTGMLLFIYSTGHFLMALFAGFFLYNNFRGNEDWSMWFIGILAGLSLFFLGSQLRKKDISDNSITLVILTSFTLLMVSIFIFIAMNYSTFYLLG